MADSLIFFVDPAISFINSTDESTKSDPKYSFSGKISPIDGISPNDLKIEELINRLDNCRVDEVIFALGNTMEGDTTNYYIFKRLKKYNLKFSAISRGIGVGDELEYADEITLGRSITNRIPFEVSLKS